MRQRLDQILSTIDEHESRLHIQKMVNAAEQSLANCALLQKENQALVVQNGERKIRKSTKATKVGTAKIMSYEDIVQAKAKREAKVAKTTSRKQRKQKGPVRPVAEPVRKPSYQVELEVAERQIAVSEYSEYCSVLCFA
jgi:phosphopantothenoylcysteine synthetase/decarboxylase